MAAVANNPAFAKKAGVPTSVGKEFMKADEGRKFSKGGDMKESKAMMKKEVGFMKKAGAPKSMIKHEMAEAGMKSGGKVKKMASGGLSAGHKSADGIAKKGKTKATMCLLLIAWPWRSVSVKIVTCARLRRRTTNLCRP
ncbi:hypothetical protein EBT25_02300 [bacterium]|nr:hypothetical protein [bacterium]